MSVACCSLFGLLRLSVCLGAAACAATPMPGRWEADTTPKPAIVIGLEQHEQTVPTRLGDVLAVRIGADQPGWVVEFDHAILAAIGAKETLRNPGPGGWLFRCVGIGSSDMVFTAPLAPCPPRTVCAPAQFEFRTRVDVADRK